MKRALLLISLTVFVATFAAATPRPKEGAITGTVLGPDGKAVSGARVMLQTSSGRGPQTRLTDEDGHYHFKEMPPGLYDLKAGANGMSSEWHHNVLLRAGKEIQVDLLLRQKKSSTKQK